MSTPEQTLTELTSQSDDDMALKRMEIGRIQSSPPSRAFTIPWDANPDKVKRTIDVVNYQLHEWGTTKYYNPSQLPSGVWTATATQLQQEDPKFFGREFLKIRILADRIKEKVTSLKELYRFWIHWSGNKSQAFDLTREVTSFFQKPRPRNFHQKINRMLANGFSPVYEQAIADFVLATSSPEPTRELMLLTTEPHRKRESMNESHESHKERKRAKMEHREPVHAKEFVYAGKENAPNPHQRVSEWYEIDSGASRFDIKQLDPLMKPYLRAHVRQGIINMAIKESNRLQLIADNPNMLENWVRRTAKALFPEKSVRLGHDEPEVFEPVSP